VSGVEAGGPGPARAGGGHDGPGGAARDGALAERLRSHIREIPDFPRPGIRFYDITTLFASAEGLDLAVRGMAEPVGDRRVDVVIGAEARGFVLGPALARELGAGFVLARKPGKLPWDTVRAEYLLEYGSDALEVHSDAVADGARVLVHDDLLATGGTADALCRLVEQLGGVVVGCSFVIELTFLPGRERLAGHDVHSLVTYASE
jgi:adenine phosphoribosyltransferase